MTEFDPRSRPPENPPDPERGARVGLLAAAAVLVIALVLGLLLWGSAQRQIVSDKNAAPLTTGTATTNPNAKEAIPPASR